MIKFFLGAILLISTFSCIEVVDNPIFPEATGRDSYMDQYRSGEWTTVEWDLPDPSESTVFINETNPSQSGWVGDLNLLYYAKRDFSVDVTLSGVVSYGGPGGGSWGIYVYESDVSTRTTSQNVSEYTFLDNITRGGGGGDPGAFNIEETTITLSFRSGYTYYIYLYESVDPLLNSEYDVIIEIN